MTVSAAAARGDRLTVTGELGDQLFGSDKMKSAFKDTPTESLNPDEACGVYMGGGGLSR